MTSVFSVKSWFHLFGSRQDRCGFIIYISSSLGSTIGGNFSNLLTSKGFVFTFGITGWTLYLPCRQFSQHYCKKLPTRWIRLREFQSCIWLWSTDAFNLVWCSQLCGDPMLDWFFQGRATHTCFVISTLYPTYIDHIQAFCESYFCGDGPWLDFVGFVTRNSSVYKQGHDQENQLL